MNSSTQNQVANRPKAWALCGGLGLLVVLCVLGVQAFMWITEVESEESGAIYLSRTAHPNLKWAFDEWERCNQGAGSYAKDGYFAKEQCDLAVAALGYKRGASADGKEAVELLRANMIAASNRIGPPMWPLSLFF